MYTLDEVQKAISAECERIENLLLDKNRKYGNSAVEPVRIFSKASAEEQIKVRMDDKIKRLMSDQIDDDEDPIFDLVGYGILLMVSRRLAKKHEPMAQKN
jgi:hypothetical protein